jgi:hypothetical protein
VRDDSLPPKVLTALDAYLAESNSKLLVVQPLRDERDTDKRPPRSAVLMECFEPPAEPQQLLARLQRRRVSPYPRTLGVAAVGQGAGRHRRQG